MIRPKHRWYDLRELISSSRVMLILLVVSVFSILYIPQLIYLFILLFLSLFALRGLIGRRCPLCDGSLKEYGAEQDKTDAFIIYINWHCPRDDYTEREKTKGNSGLFGAG